MHPDFPNEIIAQRAYALWQARGCPQGSGDSDWFTARAELEAERAESEENALFAERCREVVASIGHMHVVSVAHARRVRRARAVAAPAPSARAPLTARR